MNSKINSNFCVDLAFKFNKSIKSSRNFNIEKDNILLQANYWESVFLCWIGILINERKSSLNNLIFQKNKFSLGLKLVDNKEIAEINKKWLNKDGSTDVLSFPILCDQASVKDYLIVELGDIFISFQMAIKQSLDYEHTLKKEMLWLASHGLLHLFGWEHNNKKELDFMLNFQEYLIEKLN